jgi:hypothetical protein
MHLWLLSPAFAAPVLTAIRVEPPPSGGLCPGERFALEVVGIDARGHESKVRRNGRTPWTVWWELGEIEGKELVMPLDGRATWGRAGRIIVSSPTDPALEAEASIPVRYDCSVTLDLSGRAGEQGIRGSDGASSATRGADGANGGQGQQGHPGPELHVRTFLTTEPRTGVEVLQVEVQDRTEGMSHWAAFQPEQGELVLKANGGQGGNGGWGGNGGGGAEGGGGFGGDGGVGGTGGAGGTVSVFVDPSAQGRTSHIVVENAGGPGGLAGRGGQPGEGNSSDSPERHRGIVGREGPHGPPPEVHAASVGPLW